MINKADVLSIADYYEDDGARERCHRIKSGDLYACTDVANLISKQITLPPGAILIPVPSRRGVATTNLTICLALAKHTGASVLDCIRGEERMSLYDLKKSGQPISPDLLVLRLTEPEPEGPCYLFDAVVDSGTTMTACLSLFKHANVKILSYAMTERNQYAPTPTPTLPETHLAPHAAIDEQDNEINANLLRRHR